MSEGSDVQQRLPRLLNTPEAIKEFYGKMGRDIELSMDLLTMSIRDLKDEDREFLKNLRKESRLFMRQLEDAHLKLHEVVKKIDSASARGESNTATQSFLELLNDMRQLDSLIAKRDYFVNEISLLGMRYGITPNPQK